MAKAGWLPAQTSMLPTLVLCLSCVIFCEAAVKHAAPVFNQGRGYRNRTCAEFPEIISYHVHAVFDGTNETVLAEALSLHKRFAKAMQARMDHSNTWCPFSHPNAALGYDYICPFQYDVDSIKEQPRSSTGLFGGANYAFHIPTGSYMAAMDWWRQHHGPLVDYMMHVNTGCENHDHSVWAMSNMEYPSPPAFTQTTDGLWCCHEGPPGCYCDLVRYEQPATGLCLSGQANGSVTLAKCTPRWDDFGADTFRETWYTQASLGQPKYVQVEAWGDAPNGGNSYMCLGPARCVEGERVMLLPCAADQATTLLSWEANSPANGTAPQNGRLTSDSCPGLCVGAARRGGGAVLVRCAAAGTWTRRFLD